MNIYNDNGDDNVDSALNTVEYVLNYPVWNTYAKVSDLIPRIDLLAHPLQYMTTLVQIGYEPIPPKVTKSIFGRTQLQLPGFFTYMKYITNVDGFFGIYRGLKYNIVFLTVHRFVEINIDGYQKSKYFTTLKNKESKYENIEQLALSIACDSITKVSTLILAYPFHLMMVRSMAQFVGRETHYDSFLSAITDIYYTGGVTGFYSGFLPFAIGECTLICIESTLIFFLRNKLEQMGLTKNSSFLNSTVSIISRAIIYPFKLVSTVMSCNGHNARSLTASSLTAPEYADWTHCWAAMWARGEIKRGSSLWWRYQPINSSMPIMLQPMIQKLTLLKKNY